MDGKALEWNATSPSSLKGRKPRLGQLDGFRSLVALWLVIAHNFDPKTDEVGGLHERFCVRRYFGVQFFVVLSGFVSHYAYCDRPMESKANMWKFYVGRVGSILACYYTTQGLGIIIRCTAGHYDAVYAAVGTILSLFLLQTWVPRYSYFGNTPAWTLSTLVAHWATYPFMQRRLKALSDKLLKILIVVIPIVALLPAIILLWMGSGEVQKRYWYAMYTHPIFRFPDFALGCVSSEMFLRSDGTRWRAARLSKLSDLGIVAVASLMLAVPFSKRNSVYDTLMIEAPMLIFGLIIYCGSCDPRGSMSGYLMSLAPCRKLGDFAFQVYLWRWPLFAMVKYFESGYVPFGWTSISLLYYLPSLVILYIVSYLWYVYVDTPGRLYLARATKPSSGMSVELIEQRQEEGFQPMHTDVVNDTRQIA